MPDKAILVTDAADAAIQTPEQTGEPLPTTDSAATTPDNSDPPPAPVPAPAGANSDTAVQPQQESGDNVKEPATLSTVDSTAPAVTAPTAEQQTGTGPTVELGEDVYFRRLDQPGDIYALFAAKVTSINPEDNTVSLILFYPHYTDSIGGVSEGDGPGQFRTV